MERIILAAAAAVLIAIPAAARPYRDFTDLRTRATVGTTVIRAFPDARTPTFRLLLERQSPDFCIVWLEFAERALPIDHFGFYGKLPTSNRRALVEGPLIDDTIRSVDGSGNFATSFLADQHWVARGTKDALSLLSADVGHDTNGACVAGTRTQFTPNLVYLDVVDGERLTEYGEARLGGFPEVDPTFTLFLEFAEAGTEVETFSGGPEVLSADACILWIEFAQRAFPIYSPSALFQTSTERRVDVLAIGGGGRVGALGFRMDDTLPWISQNTGEAFRLVEAFVNLTGVEGEQQCEGRARVQFAPRIARFYR